MIINYQSEALEYENAYEHIMELTVVSKYVYNDLINDDSLFSIKLPRVAMYMPPGYTIEEYAKD